MKKLQVLSFIFSFILFIPFITFAYSISSEAYKYYTEKLINVTGNKNITNYYKIDNSSFCGSDTEGYASCSYKFLPKKPLKLSGTLTVSNFYNYKWLEFGNPYPFFKTSFKADSGNFNLDNLFIVPLNYKLNTVIPKSYLQNGIAGEISFQVDFVLDKDTLMQYGLAASKSSFVLYVKDLNINSVKGIKYYDYSEMINTMKDNNIFNHLYDSFFVEVSLDTDDKFVNVRESPNGKIIHKINVNNENYKITHQVGYLEPDDMSYDFHFMYYNFPPRNLFYSWFKILKPSKSVFKDWYFITCTYNDGRVVRGFIHSSQIDFYDTYPAYDERFYEIFNNYTSNISDLNKLSNDEVTDLFYKILEESSILRISYEKNDDIIQLLNRCISYALSDKYKLRNMNIVRSFYNFYDDDTYYKLLDKYIKDYDENYSYYE